MARSQVERFHEHLEARQCDVTDVGLQAVCCVRVDVDDHEGTRMARVRLRTVNGRVVVDDTTCEAVNKGVHSLHGCTRG